MSDMGKKEEFLIFSFLSGVVSLSRDPSRAKTKNPKTPKLHKGEANNEFRLPAHQLTKG